MQFKKILAAGIATLMVAACSVPAVSALEPHGNGLPMRNWLTNDPNYDFSDEYKTSVWYRNFTSLDFSENERNTVLRIAISQLGYHEGDSAADFDGMNMSGSSNYIEYARLLIPHYNNNHYEWCACFVNWCLNQAHIDYASSEIGCWKWVQELKGMKYWQDSLAHGGNYLPKPIMDDYGVCRYKLIDGKPVERTQAEMEADRTGEKEEQHLDARRHEHSEAEGSKQTRAGR